MKLESKVALITGGSRGIGKAVAQAYAREGAKVAFCARSANEVDITVKNLAALGGDCLGFVGDVSQEDAVNAFVRKVGERFEHVDILVNNAGVMTRPVPLAELEVSKWDYTISVNLRGVFLVTKAALPLILAQGKGTIINVSSSIGRGAYPNFAAYAASKWGLEGLTQTLAAELRSKHVRVNSVDPGYVATKLTRYSGSTPESVTDVFVFLASDESEGITGRMLNSSSWQSEVRR